MALFGLFPGVITFHLPVLPQPFALGVLPKDHGLEQEGPIVGVQLVPKAVIEPEEYGGDPI
jgi:hypothetical protein